MKFKPQQITLKNGKSVTIRSCEVSDAEQLMVMLKTYLEDSEYIPKLVSEFRLTLEQEQHWIQSFIDKENSLLLIAEYEGQPIGNIDITGHTRIIMQHTGMIGMGILQEWRNTGLGTALLQAAIEWSTQNPVLELLWLQVYTANTAGVALYQKAGFTENGIMPRFFKQDGQYFDNLTMTREVKES